MRARREHGENIVISQCSHRALTVCSQCSHRVLTVFPLRSQRFLTVFSVCSRRVRTVPSPCSHRVFTVVSPCSHSVLIASCCRRALQVFLLCVLSQRYDCVPTRSRRVINVFVHLLCSHRVLLLFLLWSHNSQCSRCVRIVLSWRSHRVLTCERCVNTGFSSGLYPVCSRRGIATLSPRSCRALTFHSSSESGRPHYSRSAAPD